MPVGEGIEVLYSPVAGSTTQLLRNWFARGLQSVGALAVEVVVCEVATRGRCWDVDLLERGTYAVTRYIYGGERHDTCKKCV